MVPQVITKANNMPPERKLIFLLMFLSLLASILGVAFKQQMGPTDMIGLYLTICLMWLERFIYSGRPNKINEAPSQTPPP